MHAVVLYWVDPNQIILQRPRSWVFLNLKFFPIFYFGLTGQEDLKILGLDGG